MITFQATTTLKADDFNKLPTRSLSETLMIISTTFFGRKLLKLQIAFSGFPPKSTTGMT